MKIIKWLDEHFEEYLMVLFLVLITCVMMLQVVIRKIPFIPSFTWAEEFCRFMWIMSVFISLLALSNLFCVLSSSPCLASSSSPMFRSMEAK